VSGEVYAVTSELFPTANLFARGHRLHHDIANSNFPHFGINSNSGEPDGAMEHLRVARNRVFAKADYRSHIVLAVVPQAG
jgi:predicted acyl esterase